jgi:hypothetical protein
MSEANIETIDAIVRWLTSLFVPVAAVLGLLYLLWSKGAPDRIERLLRPFSSVKFLGQEFVLSHPERVSASAEMTFRGYRLETRAKYDALVSGLRIGELHQALVDGVLVPAIGGIQNAKDLRTTIHVADILFAESFYQLLPYYPTAKAPGDGRSWSVRYGIVGKTWRQGTFNAEGNLAMSEADLIREWGMTEDEARTAKSMRPSLVAVVLSDADRQPVAVFYADSTTPNAFGSSKGEQTTIAEKIKDEASTLGLTRALSTMVALLPAKPLVPMLSKDAG